MRIEIAIRTLAHAPRDVDVERERDWGPETGDRVGDRRLDGTRRQHSDLFPAGPGSLVPGPQHFTQPRQRLPAMADPVLQRRIDFRGAQSVAVVGQEHRVVAEATLTA